MRIKSLLAVIAVTVILLVGTVSATDGVPAAKPRLYIEDRLVVPGSVVKIPVMVQDVQDLANMDFHLYWSCTGTPSGQWYGPFTVTQVEKGSLNQQSLFEYNGFNGGACGVKISFASTSGISGSGSIAVITCQATNDPTQFDTSNIYFSGEGFTAQTSSGAPVGFDISWGTKIEFGTSALRGDCDGNGKITTNDAQMAAQMAVGKLDKNLVCDMDDSGWVNSIDVREILKHSQAGGLTHAVVGTVQKIPAGVQQASTLPGTGGVRKAVGQ